MLLRWRLTTPRNCGLVRKELATPRWPRHAAMAEHAALPASSHVGRVVAPRQVGRGGTLHVCPPHVLPYVPPHVAAPPHVAPSTTPQERPTPMPLPPSRCHFHQAPMAGHPCLRTKWRSGLWAVRCALPIKTCVAVLALALRRVRASARHRRRHRGLLAPSAPRGRRGRTTLMPPPERAPQPRGPCEPRRPRQRRGTVARGSRQVGRW